MTMKVALVVGHCEGSKGAWNPRFNIAEYDFNNKLAFQILKLFDDSNQIEPVVVHRHLRSGIRGLVVKLNTVICPKLIISMHLNAHSNQAANGTEVLHWHRSKRSGEIAKIFERHFTDFLQTRDRSGQAQAKGVSEEDRGGYILRYTNAWCVLCEPFFLSNDKELHQGLESLSDGSLADAYVKAITECVNRIQG